MECFKSMNFEIFYYRRSRFAKIFFFVIFFNDSPPLSHHNIYISAFFNGALQKYNSVNIMVNNAGIIHEKQWKKCVDINLVSSISMTGQSFIHMMYDNT
jgi:hypothetical protein